MTPYNVLVTGGTGFLGSSVVRRLIKQSHNVFVLHRSQSSFGRLEGIDKELNLIEIGNVDISSVFSTNSFDCVVHCATEYGRSRNPSQVLKANLIFPLELLEESIQHGVSKFINIDSFTSKFKGYPYLRSYHQSKNDFQRWKEITLEENDQVSFCTLRVHHMYGPFDSENKFIPWFIQQCLSGQDTIALTNGLQKRDFVYVEDVTDAIMKLIDTCDKINGDFEVGSYECHSIKEVCGFIASEIEEFRGNLQFGALPMRPNEVMHSLAQKSGLQSLGWQPSTTLKSGLRMTIDYFRKIKEDTQE